MKGGRKDRVGEVKRGKRGRHRKTEYLLKCSGKDTDIGKTERKSLVYLTF